MTATLQKQNIPTKMQTFFISDGVAYRNRRMNKTAISIADKCYLKKITSFSDKVWMYFTKMEDDFRLLHMPMVR